MRQSYASLLLLVPAFFGLACGGPVTYNVTPIPPPFSVGDGGAINNNGQIVGSGPYYTYSTWSAAAGYQVSPPFSNFFEVEAYSINNLGVAGGELVGTGIKEAFIGNTPLGLGGTIETFGNTLNDAGQLAGQGCFASAPPGCQGFIATTAGYQFLSPPAGIYTAFYGINSQGVATGYSSPTNSQSSSNLIYGTAAGITTVPLPATGWSGMFGLTINDSGNIRGNGYYYGAGGDFNAFYFDGSSITTLAPDYYFFQVPQQCMNNRNQVIGEGSLTFAEMNSPQAFLWDPVNGLQLLNNLVPAGWNITGVYGINDSGSIVGYGSYKGGMPGDVLLSVATPQPSAKVGIYRPKNGDFLLDTNGDDSFDMGDTVYKFLAPLGGPQAGDLPVVGDWSGSGTTKVGIFRAGFEWILDWNGDGVYDTGDVVYQFGGVAGDIPVVGDWTGTGTSKIGVVRDGFFWLLDANGDGTYDGTAGGDYAFPFGGIPGDVPVVGDWTGDGVSKVGMFRDGFFWVLDTADPSVTNATGSAPLIAFPFGGIAGDVPIVEKWFAPPASMTPTGGTPQGSAINTAFAAPLALQVIGIDGSPVSGITVEFTVPISGASATFAGSQMTAVTNLDGVTSSAILTANGTTGGPYNVTATIQSCGSYPGCPGSAAPANFSLTNTSTPALRSPHSQKH
jgi:hypothetical protein